MQIPKEDLLKLIRSKPRPSSYTVFKLNKKKRTLHLPNGETSIRWHATLGQGIGYVVDNIIKSGNKTMDSFYMGMSSEAYMRNRFLLNFKIKHGFTFSKHDDIISDMFEMRLDDRPSLGMFMPIETVVDKMMEKLQKDGPALLLKFISDLQNLVANEMGTCSSCGTACHIPDADSVDDENAKKVFETLHAEKRHICIPCGRDVLVAGAKLNNFYKGLKIDALINSLESMDVTSSNADYDRMQATMKQIMIRIGNQSMLLGTSQNTEMLPSQPKGGSDTPPPIPGYLN